MNYVICITTMKPYGKEVQLPALKTIEAVNQLVRALKRAYPKDLIEIAANAAGDYKRPL
jgi:hypothetical protein